MPDFEPTGKVVHRTDAPVVSLPWSYIAENLASESFYRVEFRQPGSHNLMDLMVFVITDGEKFRIITTFEMSDVTYKHGKEIRNLAFGWTVEDPLTFDKLSEALTAAKIEAVLHHAHSKKFKQMAEQVRRVGNPAPDRMSGSVMYRGR